MKIELLALVVIFTSFQAMAGPEEHMMNQKCYVLEQSYDTSVPSELCIETVDIDLSTEKMLAYSYFQEFAELYKDLSVNYLVRKNEDFHSFRSEAVISSKTENGLGEKLTLKISGIVDNYGSVDVQFLTIMLLKELTNSYHDNAVTVRNFSYRLR